MTVAGISFGLFDLLGIPHGGFAGAEVGDREFRHIAHDLALGAHDLRTAASASHECLHREGGRHAVFEDHVGHIVVALVVVHLEDAAAVVGSFQAAAYLFVACRLFARQIVEYPEMGMFAHVDVDGRIGTLRLVRTAVRAAFGRAFGFVGFGEVHQTAVGRDRLAGRSHQPADDIEVVARLGQNDRSRLFGVVPVAAHVRVRHVCVLDRLEMLNADQPADLTRIDRLLECDEVGGVAQHVANADDRLLFQRQIADGRALLLGGGDRFFEQEVIPHLQSLHGGGIVQVVW